MKTLIDQIQDQTHDLRNLLTEIEYAQHSINKLKEKTQKIFDEYVKLRLDVDEKLRNL